MATTWTTVSTQATSWTTYGYDFKHTWADWSAYTWAQIASTSAIWALLGGELFATTTQATTVWTTTTG